MTKVTSPPSLSTASICDIVTRSTEPYHARWATCSLVEHLVWMNRGMLISMDWAERWALGAEQIPFSLRRWYSSSCSTFSTLSNIPWRGYNWIISMSCNVCPFVPFLILIPNSLGHRFDYDTPIAETASRYCLFSILGILNRQMHALHDVVKAGYVRYIGMSSCHAYQCTSLLSLLTHSAH